MSRVTYVILIFILYHITRSSTGHAAASWNLRALAPGGPSCENRNEFDKDTGLSGNFPACDTNGGKKFGDTCQPCCECNCGGPNDKSKCMTLLPVNTIEPRVCEHYGDKFVTYDGATYGEANPTGCADQCIAFCVTGP